MEIIKSSLETFGYLFYLVNPSKHMFESLDQVPDYIAKTTPFFFTFLILEQLILFVKGWKRYRINDSLVSIAQGVLMEQSKLFLKSLIIVHYIYVHENLSIFQYENSIFTWIVTLLALDFIFYWFHRASHEINILWAFHQVHHSSEHFNLTTALRQSVFQVYLHCFCNIPLAMVISPPMYMVHLQLNVLYQIWIHTEFVGKLGPLEWILNTPSAHRVHHGRNRYCIDRNYAGVLIIWDRIFGTYQAEREAVAYGLVHPIKSFDPLVIQSWNIRYIWNRLKSASSVSEKLGILFAGPGWSPGKPRLGLAEEIPEIDPIVERERKYDPEIPIWLTIYVSVHFIIILILHAVMMEQQHDHQRIGLLGIFSNSIFVMVSIYVLSKLLEGGSISSGPEIGRCIMLFAIDPLGRYPIFSSNLQVIYFNRILKIFFLISLLFWMAKIFKSIQFLRNKKLH
ncbi:alkylglycerol monooxygenase [Brevipalpus obovatus]|uniref:alkylglycerol monooxygenase n=1 Tax=Brevipalpus obovatus TaxID=246614 RepID=UPI003D9F76B3